MLKAGLLRVLDANAPDPYPDSIHVTLEDLAEEDDTKATKGHGKRAKRGSVFEAINKRVASAAAL